METFFDDNPTMSPDPMDALVDRACGLLVFMGVREATEHLATSGASFEDAYLAVNAAAVLLGRV